MAGLKEIIDSPKGGGDVPLEAFTGILREYMHEFVIEEVEKQVAIGNDKFTVVNDGKLAGSDRTELIKGSNLKVQVDFILGAIDIAIDVMRQEFARAIGEFMTSTPNAPRVRVGGKTQILGPAKGTDLQANIRIFYGPKDKPVVEVTHTTEIEGANPGDFIMLTVDDPLGWLANSPKLRTGQPWTRGNPGFMGRTARRIRSKLRISARTSPLRVQAGFSQIVGARFGVSESTGGTAASRYGHPVIYIRIRDLKGN